MAGAGKIHPGRLLLTLKVLLAPSGGIKSSAEVDRLVPLMEKFSRKLVSRIIYLNVLLNSSNDLLELFLSRKGWNLLSLWFVGATNGNNVPLRIKLLQVCLRCSPPPPHEEFDEMLKSIKALTKRIKQIEMSVLALQVLNKWKIPTSLGNSSDTNVFCGASTKETKPMKRETTIKTETFSTFTIPKRIKKFRPGSLRVTYQDGDCIKDHEGSKKNDGAIVDVTLQTWSRINGLKRKEVYSSLSSYAAADKVQSRLAAIPSRSQGSKQDLKVENQDDGGVKKVGENSVFARRNGIKDVNENVTKSFKIQATSNTFFCEDKFYDEDLKKENGAEENSSNLKRKSSQLTVREDSEKRRKEVDDFKRKRKEERDQKLKRQEEQQKAKISFNKTEYKRDLDNESKKKIKELAESLKHQDEKEEKSSTKKEITTTSKNPSPQKSERYPSRKEDRSSSSSSPNKSERNPSKKEDRSSSSSPPNKSERNSSRKEDGSSSSSSPNRSERNPSKKEVRSSSSSSPKRRKASGRNRDSSKERLRSKSRRKSRSRDRTSRGGRDTISGIRRLRRSKSRSRSRSRSPRKRRRVERELRSSSASSKSKPEPKSSSRVSPPKEVLKEVNLFNDELLKSCRDSKPKRISRVQSKSSRSSSKSKSSGSDSKAPVPEKSNEKDENTKHRKRVTWSKDENLVSVRFFEVIEEERGNVFKQKFTERRKLEAKNEKLKLTAASKAKSFECESSCSTAESLKDIIKTPVSGSSWPSLIPLAGLRTDIQIGSESEEKLIQRAREAQVQPLLILPGAEPTEAETIHQRRSMVVSVKSILPVDISGEGTITDFSAGGWTNPFQLTRGVKYRTSNVPGYSQSSGAVKGGKVPVPCIYWGRGYCRNGDVCRFLHEPKADTNQE